MTKDRSSPASFGPVRASRREKMLDAAEGFFASQGYRGATMEGLAEAAGVSKATIYAYFRDKDAAFHAVAERLARRIEDAAGKALAGAGPLPERIAQALVAKHTIVFEAVRSSPFAEELFAARNRAIAALFETLDGEIKAMLARAMIDAGFDRGAADSTARLLFGAAQGIANHDSDVPTMQADITALVNAIVC